MPPNYEQMDRCINEVERAILRVGEERCEHLRQGNQLSAVLLLLLRCTSLFRSMARLYRSEDLDAFDAVRRALVEWWDLALQFRMRSSGGEVSRWLARRPGTWSADLASLEQYARNRGYQAPDLGRQYGLLSELAHPTRDAAENSAALTLKRLGIPNVEDRGLAQAIALFEGELSAQLYRITWLLLHEDGELIPLHVDENSMPTAVAFAEGYPNV